MAMLAAAQRGAAALGRRTFMAGSGNTMSVLGAPSNLGQRNDSPAHGPASLRDVGILENLRSIGWAVNDRGDIPFTPKAGTDSETMELIARGNKLLSDEVADAYLESDTTLILGGDHSVSIGSVSGVLRRNPDIGVLWVDAHCDINTPASSPSKNIHGMVLSYLMKLFPTVTNPPFDWLTEIPKLHPAQLAFIGARDIDPAERTMLKNLGITCFTMHSIDKYGIGKVTEMALDHLDGRNLHVSYDIDATDPGIAPSTGTPVRGGLTYREAHYIAEEIASTGMMRSMDMVEVDPYLSAGGSDTVELAAALVSSAFGQRII
mmetsp:Transcript_23400/g.61244  ORF Transcript_23400/g.61244 Transcript_23400/m.61244 type:complete len:319 (+) Transcript_23400:172-1128(+)